MCVCVRDLEKRDQLATFGSCVWYCAAMDTYFHSPIIFYSRLKAVIDQASNKQFSGGQRKAMHVRAMIDNTVCVGLQSMLLATVYHTVQYRIAYGKHGPVASLFPLLCAVGRI